MSRIAHAFSSFFSILFSNELPEDVAAAYGFVKQPAKKAETKAAPAALPVKPSDGALQMLGILQRDSRIVDFLMEDITTYTDEQVGAAVRSMHEQAAATLKRYIALSPVIDGVEGTYSATSAAGVLAKEAAAIKFLGNVPAQGKPQGGTLRHRGWQATKVELPELRPSSAVKVIAPAEIEVE